MTHQDIKEQIEQLEFLRGKHSPREAAKVVSKLQSEAFILKVKIAEAEAEFEKRSELTDALTQQILALRKLQLKKLQRQLQCESAEMALQLAKLQQSKLKLRVEGLERKNAEVEPTVGELFHDITIKVGQKEIQDFLEVYRRDTEESVKQVVQALSPTKH